MSMRTIARSSSNRKSASDLASSVLPMPVGPRNRNEPVGRLGSEMPARERRTASLTALTAAALADQPLADDLLHLAAAWRSRPRAAGRWGCRSRPRRRRRSARRRPPRRPAARRRPARSRPSSAARRSASRARGSGRRGSRWRLRGRPRAAAARPRCAAGRAGGAARPRPRATAFSCSQRASSAAQLLLAVGEVGAQPLQPVDATRRRSPCSSANSSIFIRSTGAAELVDLLRRGLDLHPQPRRRPRRRGRSPCRAAGGR